MTRQQVLDHFDDYLGEGEQVDSVGSIAIWRYERDEFVSFVTVGLSESDIRAVYPQELVCSVEEGQDGAADYLVKSTLELVLPAQYGLVDNQVIRNDQPLLARTQISAVLAADHPYLDEQFNVVYDDERNIASMIMTLIPLTTPEADLAQARGIDDLFATLEDRDPPLLDVTRRSAV